MRRPQPPPRWMVNRYIATGIVITMMWGWVGVASLLDSIWIFRLGYYAILWPALSLAWIQEA